MIYALSIYFPAIMGYSGLLDDMVVFIAAYYYVYASFRALLVARHAA